MKKKILLLLFAFSPLTFGANVFISNIVFAGPGDTLYADSNGTPLNGGAVTLGYFADGYDVMAGLGSPMTLVSDFNVILTVLSGAFTSNLGGAFAGYADTPMSTDFGTAGVITSPDPLIGRSLYIFAGNQSTLGNSTQFLLLDLGITLRDDVPTEQDYVGSPAGLSPLIGSTGTFVGNTGAGFGTYQTVQLAIPEPSTLLLTALGALALLRRKR